jgi:uracil-DNA glycosylase
MSTAPQTVVRDQIKLDPSWLRVVGEEFDKPYMAELKAFLMAEKKAGKVIYPAGENWFNALNTTPFESVEVVVLGQDPYHGPGQAHGLCFSVLPGVPAPPSLVNIFKELNSDLGIPVSRHGCLQQWAQQGVLLLNSVLTVEQGRAGSHQGRGWETFTDACIAQLNREREGLVFLLWGSYAMKKGQLIDRKRHLVLEGPHPSPLSAHRGFFGCKHFSRANQYLEQNGKKPIDWGLK